MADKNPIKSNYYKPGYAPSKNGDGFWHTKEDGTMELFYKDGAPSAFNSNQEALRWMRDIEEHDYKNAPSTMLKKMAKGALSKLFTDKPKKKKVQKPQKFDNSEAAQKRRDTAQKIGSRGKEAWEKQHEQRKQELKEIRESGVTPEMFMAKREEIEARQASKEAARIKRGLTPDVKATLAQDYQKAVRAGDKGRMHQITQEVRSLMQ